MQQNEYVKQEKMAQTDGRFYTLKDMVRAGCQDCKGCFACCTGMDKSILLDPFDIYQFQKAGAGSGAKLIQEGLIELSVYKGLILPNLKMSKERDCCGFLDEEGRCSVHEYRPGICRLFPLGRNYENDVLTYILLKDACTSITHSKIKVEKWIGIQPAEVYQAYLETWHAFRMKMSSLLAEEDGKVRNTFLQYIVQTFYLQEYDLEKDFYTQFYEKIERIKKAVGLS